MLCQASSKLGSSFNLLKSRCRLNVYNMHLFATRTAMKEEPYHPHETPIRSRHEGPKAYMRIWPAAKNLMLIYDISIDELPKDVPVIMKSHVLDLIEKKAKEKEFLSVASQSLFKKSPTKKLPVIPAFNKMKTESKINEVSEESLSTFDFKSKIPQIYFSHFAQVDNLIQLLSQINSKLNKNIKIEDFIAKAAARIIESNENLRLVYDKNANKISKLTNVPSVYLKTFSKDKSSFKEEEFVYLNPQKVNFTEVTSVKKSLKEFKEKYIPVIRIYNYIDVNAKVDGLIIPPAVFTLSLGPISNILVSDEENPKKIKVVKNLNMSLTAFTTALEEDVATAFMVELAKAIESPFSLSL